VAVSPEAFGWFGRTLAADIVRMTRDENGSPMWEMMFPKNSTDVLGIVPFSEMAVSEEIAPRFVGQRINVKVLGYDLSSNRVLCSRKEAVREAEQRLSLYEGQVIECVIRGFLPPGDDKPPRLVVDIGGGILVEVPRIDATWSRIRPLREMFREGQVVRAKVLSVDPLKVSIKEAGIHPWEKAEFKPGDVVSGWVTKTDKENGHVWVEVLPGVEGLAPYPLRGEVKRGDRVSCAVASFDREERKLRLRLRGFSF